MIAIIPAKSRSTRLEGKNVLPLNGKPLVQYTIEAAKEAAFFTEESQDKYVQSKCFDEIIVSSESAEICDLADSLGVTGLRRDEALASDTATVNEVLKSVLSRYDAESFALLLPTSPLRTSEDIKQAYKQFTESDVACLMSVVPLEYPHEWSLTVANGKLVPSDKEGYTKIRQALTPTYKHDGSIIMAKTDAFMAASNWDELNPVPYFSDIERAVDVNTELDYKMAEALLGQIKRTDGYYIDKCLELTARSTCLRTKIACLIVKDDQIISTGYNGAPDSLESCAAKGKCPKAASGLEWEAGNAICRGVHGEMRAMAQAKTDLEGATVYTSKQPCAECTKVLIQAGISRVLWAADWGNAKASEAVRGESGIEFHRYDERPLVFSIGGD